MKQSIVKIENPLNRFNVSILLSSIFLIVFLLAFSAIINFEVLTKLEKFFYLGLEVCISIIIFFGISRIINGKDVKGFFS